MKILSPRNVAPAKGPYAQGLLVDPGKMCLFMSGQVGYFSAQVIRDPASAGSATKAKFAETQ